MPPCAQTTPSYDESDCQEDAVWILRYLCQREARFCGRCIRTDIKQRLDCRFLISDRSVACIWSASVGAAALKRSDRVNRFAVRRCACT